MDEFNCNVYVFNYIVDCFVYRGIEKYIFLLVYDDNILFN